MDVYLRVCRRGTKWNISWLLTAFMFLFILSKYFLLSWSTSLLWHLAGSPLLHTSGENIWTSILRSSSFFLRTFSNDSSVFSQNHSFLLTQWIMFSFRWSRSFLLSFFQLHSLGFLYERCLHKYISTFSCACAARRTVHASYLQKDSGCTLCAV